MTGGDKSLNIAAPVWIFVSNVNQGIKEETIMTHMKTKGLNITEMTKISHNDARNLSFKAAVQLEEKEKALSGDIWPYGVKVREYRQYRRREDRGKSNNQFQ